MEINDEGRKFIVHAVCESFMEMVLSFYPQLNMYMVDNNS